MPQPVFADHPAHVQRLIDVALAAADPFKAVARAIEAARNREKPPKSCVLVAAGKASIAMSRAIVEAGGVKPVVGVVVAPPGSRTPASLATGSVRLMEADHPLPTQKCLIAAQAVSDAARIAGSRGLPLVVMLSGGASAHLTFPDHGMTLSDIRVLTERLMKAGTPIRELNTVRKHCERLKGGGLARAASPSPVFAYILADVLGEPPPVDAIASGPTAPDPTTFAEVIEIIERRGVNAPDSIMEHLRKGAKGKAHETLKEDDPIFNRVLNMVVGSNGMALAAAVDAAGELGLQVVEARMNVEGDARAVGKELAARVLAVRDEQMRHGQQTAGATQPRCIIWGGETTVVVRGQGFGGRSQELALSAAMNLDGQARVAIASFATDGIDGIAPPGEKAAAGAIVTGQTCAAAREQGVDLSAALAANDSFAAAKKLGLQIGKGPTGTNVNDLMIGVVY